MDTTFYVTLNLYLLYGHTPKHTSHPCYRSGYPHHYTARMVCLAGRKLSYPIRIFWLARHQAILMYKRNLEVKSLVKTKPEPVDVNKLFGKKVLTHTGKKIGVVEHIMLHPKKLAVEELWIRKNFWDVKRRIPKRQIQRLTKNAVMLNTAPLINLVSKKVYDLKGKKVGTVKTVKRSKKTDSLVSFVIDRGITKKNLIVARKAIKNIGENIILNVSVKD